MIKFLIFDLDGTLYEKKSVVLRYLQEFSDREKYNFDDIHQIFTNSYILAKKETFLSPSAFWSRVHDLFMNSIKSSKRELLDKLAEEAKQNVLLGITPRKNTTELLRKAKESGIKIIVFTGSNDMYDSINFNESKEEILELKKFKLKQLEILGLLNYIDRLILTSEYGGYKPQKLVFEKLLEDIKAQPEECLMIGDTYNDIGARQLGIFSIMIGDNDAKKFTPNLRIKEFKEIIDIIDFDKCSLR